MAKKKERKRGKPSKFIDLKGVHLKIPNAMNLEIVQKAKELDISKSEFVRRAVREYIDDKRYAFEPRVNEIAGEDIERLSHIFSRLRRHDKTTKEFNDDIQHKIDLVMEEFGSKGVESLQKDALEDVFDKMLDLMNSDKFKNIPEFDELYDKIENYLAEKS